MTTDTGIDLVAFSTEQKDSFTFQVKTTFEARPGGGKGRMSLDWWLPKDCPADFSAFVDLSTQRIWLMTIEEVSQLAQQQPNTSYHFFMTVDPEAAPRRYALSRL